MQIAILLIYCCVALIALALSINMVWLAFSAWYRLRRQPQVSSADMLPDTLLPSVAIQLPVHNEERVLPRLIRAVAAIEYPHDKLEIQVLNDGSTDDSEAQIESVLAELRQTQKALRIEHIYLENQSGYKAGALNIGLQQTQAEFVVIFDADFLPKEDFLKKTIPAFLKNTKLGFLQVRNHARINEDTSMLCRAFSHTVDVAAVTHWARKQIGAWSSFHGSAGVIRRKAIDDVGGWRTGSSSEDMELSYDLLLKGYEDGYLLDYATDCEVPWTLPQFLSQRRRWAYTGFKGGLYYIPKIFRSSNSWVKQFQAVCYFLGHLLSPIYVFVILSSYPIFSWVGWSGIWPRTTLVVLIASLICLASTSFFVQKSLGRPFRVQDMLTSFLVQQCIALSACISFFQAMLGVAGTFNRTPKGNLNESASRKYKADKAVSLLEQGVLLFSLFVIYGFVVTGSWGIEKQIFFAFYVLSCLFWCCAVIARFRENVLATKAYCTP